jgi:hypothetical protein
MNTTKALALPAIAVMAATLLAGCGNTTASSSTPTKGTDAMMTESAMATPSAMMTEGAMSSDPTMSPDAMATDGAMMSESAMATAGTNG